VYGIRPAPGFRGLLDFGADVQFRRWGKLESPLEFGAAPPGWIRKLAACDRLALSIVNPLAAALEPVSPKRKLNGAYALARASTLARVTRAAWKAARRSALDDFVVEVFNPGPRAVSLIVEVHQGPVRFRDALALEPGQSFHRIPVSAMNIAFDSVEGRVLVYPEKDAEVRLIFTWLDFVRYARVAAARRGGDGRVRAGEPAPTERARPPAAPGRKVKCVAWDLDNTIWEGILVEDGSERLVVRREAVVLVKRLDERGILNTVVSKNDMEPAWAKLEELGLSEYFVSPAINWGPKSANLASVSEALNIGLDTFALIDDSPFERSEVASTLPQVRVFTERDVGSLIDRPEFDVPVSAESRSRRLSYLAEAKRRAIAATYGERYEDFLRSCAMRAVLFRPSTAEERERALELILRSNQLNLSTRRYSGAEFEALLEDPTILSLAWRCHDCHGDYGTVGVMLVSLEGSTPVLRDLVISCRVAKKKVENALFCWLVGALRERGDDRLHAVYYRTARNHVLLEALTEVGFAPTGRADGADLLELRVDADVACGDIVAVDAAALDLPWRRRSSRAAGAGGAATVDAAGREP
jgi:FkbH-like protein